MIEPMIGRLFKNDLLVYQLVSNQLIRVKEVLA